MISAALTWPTAAIAQDTSPEPSANSQLAEAKLRAEIAKLEAEEQKVEGDDAWWARAPTYGALLTAVIGIPIFLFGAYRQSKDANDRRFDERFSATMQSLSSDKPAVRASGATSLQTFLRPKNRPYHDQVFGFLVANLKFEDDEFAREILVRGFEKAARVHLEAVRRDEPTFELDLSNAHLGRTDLSGLDLSRCDLKRADLTGANLENAILWRAQGFGVVLRNARLTGANLQEARMKEAKLQEARFGGARLVSAVLKEADATGASFQRALLQEAHLEGATLIGTSFHGADLNNAYFYNARFDLGPLKSIAFGALNWRKANFDEAVLDRLYSLNPPEA